MNVAIFSPQPSAVWVDKPGWATDGFREAGHSVRRCHDLADLPAAHRECDLLLFDQNAAGLQHIDLAISAERRAWREHNVWALWQRDLIASEVGKPLAEQCTLQTHGRLFKAVDVAFVKERSMLGEYAAIGINARYLDQASTSDYPKCSHVERPEWDVLVFGCTDYKQRRSDVRSLVGAGFRVLWLADVGDLPPGVAGHPWVHPRDLHEVVSRCGVVLGVDLRSDVPCYTSDRTYLAAGMGACYVARVEDYGSDSGSLSPAADLAAWVYSDQEQLLRIVSQALADRDERERRGYASRARVLAKHTYKHRAEEICGVVESLRGERLAAAAGSVS